MRPMCDVSKFLLGKICHFATSSSFHDLNGSAIPLYLSSLCIYA